MLLCQKFSYGFLRLPFPSKQEPTRRSKFVCCKFVFLEPMLKRSFQQVKRLVLLKLRVNLELDPALNPSMVRKSQAKSDADCWQDAAISAMRPMSKRIMATTMRV